MFTAGDVARWVEEGAPALRGAFVHRVWRTERTWALLVRHHENEDPEERATERVALEIGLAAEFARCVALTPEAVQADDKKLKKAWGKDAHPYLSLLRKELCGSRVEAFEQVGGDRILRLRCQHTRDDHEGPRGRDLVVELIGRNGNLILCQQGGEEPPVVVRALNAGRAKRPLAEGEVYQGPPPRPGGADAAPALRPDLAPNHETLALGLAVAEEQRAKEEEAAQSSRREVLLRAVKKAIGRCEGVLKKLESQLADVAKADDYERQGDLLKANLGQLPDRHGGKVTVTDYASGEAAEVELSLDPNKGIHDNMKALYKKAKKLRKGEVHVLTRQGETDGQMAELREAQAGIEATDPQDEEALDRYEALLRKLKALPKASKKPKQKQQVNQGPRTFVTKEGHQVLVGRNDDENDRLTMRTARGKDLFFHVAGCPGSHVILRVDPNRPPNHESLLDAASLAAYYSKARQRGTVDVHYTPRKWVKKPKGAKPGLVQISNFKTVRASGTGERIQRVLATARTEDDQ